MSLLIDALRQAEANQKQIAPARALPTETSLQLVLDEHHGLATPERSALAAHSRSTCAASREAVHGQFEVKHSPARHLSLILGTSILGLLALGGVWWITQFRDDAALASIAPARAAPSIQAPTLQAVVPTESGTQPAPSIATTPDQPKPRQIQTSMKVEPDQPSSPTPPILRRTLPSPMAGDTPTQQGLATYAAGNLEQAHQELLHILRTEPNNIEALNAMAMIALRNGHSDEAERYYRHALLVDPKDANARAQLAMLYSEADPVAAESRLRLLLIEQPESSPAMFALGSLQARQGRWHEAQQAFFQAHTLDANNADTLYNLAVSLDHLNQPALAEQYYTRATQTAATHPNVVAFDLAAAQHRANLLVQLVQHASAAGNVPVSP